MEKKTEPIKVAKKLVLKVKKVVAKPVAKIDLKSRLLASAKAKNKTKPVLKNSSTTGGIDIA